MHITVDTLKELDACEDQVQLFESTFPDGTDITAESLALARDVGLDIGWLIGKAPSLFEKCSDMFLQSPEWAYYYALHVDKQPHDDTRAAACRDTEWAYYYALRVDKQPHDDTRAACRDTEWAYYYALRVDKQPHDDTRAAACRDPMRAYHYAAYVDKQTRDDTRAAACRDPEWARYYDGYMNNKD